MFIVYCVHIQHDMGQMMNTMTLHNALPRKNKNVCEGTSSLLYDLDPHETLQWPFYIGQLLLQSVIPHVIYQCVFLRWPFSFGSGSEMVNMCTVSFWLPAPPFHLPLLRAEQVKTGL